MLIKIFFPKILYIFLEVIDPCLNIVGDPVRSIIVDSRPILHLPPLRINLTLLLNSSITSYAEVGLNLDDIFALGAAKGKLNFLRSFLATGCFGNLMAIVFFPPVALLDILDVVGLVNAVLSGGYSAPGDMNQDGVLDVLDIVGLVNTILNP